MLSSIVSFVFCISMAIVTKRLNKISKPPIVTWIIDGNNLKGFRGVPSDRQAIIDELQTVASPPDRMLSSTVTLTGKQQPISNVVLVFDSNNTQNESFQKASFGPWFEYVIATPMKNYTTNDRADDYIIHQAMPQLSHEYQNGKIHLVTADKDLGKRAVASGWMKGGSIVNPSKFWKKYLPSLKQIQNYC